MKGRAGADPLGQAGRGSEDERAAHAISLRADALGGVDLRFAIEKFYVRLGVALDRFGRVQRGGPQVELAPVGGIAEVERGRIGDDRRLRVAVERIRHQHRIAERGEAPPEGAERRPQAEHVGPDQHARMLPVLGMEIRRVADAVAGLDVHVAFDDGVDLPGDGAGGRDEPGGRGRRDELAPRQVIVVAHRNPPSSAVAIPDGSV